MPELDWTDMPIHQAIKSDWKSPELLVEGSLNSAKTTVTLDKEIDAALKYHGIPLVLCRWTEDAVATKLRKAFEDILGIRGVPFSWDAKQKLYSLPNDSTATMFGLKASSEAELFSKLRGMPASRILVDQAEEMKRAVADELRGRFRPDIIATTIRRTSFPFQLTLVANPSGETFWLSKQFPVDNHIVGRKLYSLSVYDNKHLPQASIDSLLRTYAVEHPKHQTMILGKRGLNIDGDPVYEGMFDRALHVVELMPRPDLPVLTGFEMGRHNPVWIAAQRGHNGRLALLGGIMGKQMMLEDFLPIVRDFQQDWFEGARIKACTSPMGETAHTAGSRQTLLNVLRESGIKPIWRENANAPDVQLAMIEAIGGLLRRRTIAKEESFAINAAKDRWLVIVDGQPKPVPFMSFAFEGGFVWDEHAVSVSNKSVRQPREDDEYANAMHCLENIVLNFCAGKQTDAERASRRAAQRTADDPAETRDRTAMDWAR
jgi:hypothetical protein